MTDPDFPEELRSFIEETIPTVDAAELLVVVAQHSDRQFRGPDIVDAMRPTAISEPAAGHYLTHFEQRGLVAGNDSEGYRYSPSTPTLDAMVRALSRVFNERPVTLVRMIYAPKDDKIRSFADAFRIKK